MALLLPVKWVHQSDDADSRGRIQFIGGDSGYVRWKHALDVAIDAIEKNTFHYYVKDGATHAKLEVGFTSEGLKYLKTQADEDEPLLLLKLPDFPPDERPV